MGNFYSYDRNTGLYQLTGTNVFFSDEKSLERLVKGYEEKVAKQVLPRYALQLAKLDSELKIEHYDGKTVISLKKNPVESFGDMNLVDTLAFNYVTGIPNRDAVDKVLAKQQNEDRLHFSS